MSAPDLSALATPFTRLRLTYALSWSVASVGEPDFLLGLVNNAVTNTGHAVLYQPATAPVAAPDSELGLLHNAVTTLDLLTDTALPTMSWDQFLAPLRNLGALFLDPLHITDSAVLQDTAFVAAAGTPAGTAAAVASANTQASQQGAAQLAATPSNPVDAFVQDVQKAATWAAGNLGTVALILGLVLALTFAPELTALFRKTQRAAA